MKANVSEEPVDVRVRRRLRELRTERGLTLQQVAERASIDISTLSRLEAGKRRLALDHVPALAAALGVSADELLGSAPPQDPRVRGRPRKYDGMTMWPLTHRGPAGGLQAYKINVSPERRTPPEVLPVHEGHDWLYVLDGRLRLMLGDEDLTIEPGEAVEFTTWTPHWFGVLDGPVELIAILGPHGERLHLHA
jgi:transcriptional regulator with XRE-family HTH domain